MSETVTGAALVALPILFNLTPIAYVLWSLWLISVGVAFLA